MILLIGLCFAAHCLLFFLLLLLCCKTCPSHTLHWPARYRTAQVLFWFLPTTLRRTQTHLGRLFCPADRNITASAGCSFFLLRFLHWRSLMAVDRECRPSCDQVWVVVFSVVLQRVCKTVCVCVMCSRVFFQEKKNKRWPMPPYSFSSLRQSPQNPLYWETYWPDQWAACSQWYILHQFLFSRLHFHHPHWVLSESHFACMLCDHWTVPHWACSFISSCVPFSRTINIWTE